MVNQGKSLVEMGEKKLTILGSMPCRVGVAIRKLTLPLGY